MKLKQIYKQLIDWRMGKEDELYYSRYEEKMTCEEKVLVGNQFQFYVLNNKDFLLNLEKCRETSIFKNIMEDVDNLVPLVPTGKAERHSKDLIDVYRTSEENEQRKVGINPKFLKHFEDYELRVNCKENAISKVFVYENDKMVGLVCPARLSQNE